MVSFLVGTPISHSRSPALHHVIDTVVNDSVVSHRQVLCETDDLASFVEFLRSHPKAIGSGVTMPFKVAAMHYMDELTSTAKTVGAINTIFFKSPSPSSHERWLVGTNTDVIGIRDAILQHTTTVSSLQQPLQHTTALIVGGGGTSRAAIYALHALLGCQKIYLTNRDPAEVSTVISESISHHPRANLYHLRTEHDASLLPTHHLPSLIISCVPDYPPQTSGEHSTRAILALLLSRRLNQACPLLEMCYHPNPDTEITRLALKAGWKVIGGIEAMVGQGIAQNQLWLNREIDGPTRAEIKSVVRRGLDLESTSARSLRGRGIE